jgi:predicted NBD/HSP70 family sugar kinase
MTNIVGELLRNGIVHETGIIEGIKGRRSIAIELDAEQNAVLGIRLERTYAEIGLFNLSGQSLVDSKEVCSRTSKSEKNISEITKGCRRILGLVDSRRPMAIGIAIPGPLIRPQNTPTWLESSLNMDLATLKRVLADTFSCKVIVEHDAKAAALSRWYRFECAVPNSSLLYITVGQGVGAGLVDAGNLFRGSHGIAVEIGHFSIDADGLLCSCGNRGCVEMYCSTTAVLRSVPERYRAEGNPLECLRTAYLQGERWAAKIVNQSAKRLGIGISTAINAYDPDKVVIGAEMSQFGPAYLKYISEEVESRLRPEMFEHVSLDLDIGDSDAILSGIGNLAGAFAMGLSIGT